MFPALLIKAILVPSRFTSIWLCCYGYLSQNVRINIKEKVQDADKCEKRTSISDHFWNTVAYMDGLQ